MLDALPPWWKGPCPALKRSYDEKIISQHRAAGGRCIAAGRWYAKAPSPVPSPPLGSRGRGPWSGRGSQRVKPRLVSPFEKRRLFPKGQKFLRVDGPKASPRHPTRNLDRQRKQNPALGQPAPPPTKNQPRGAGCSLPSMPISPAQRAGISPAGGPSRAPRPRRCAGWPARPRSAGSGCRESAASNPAGRGQTARPPARRTV